MESAIWDWAKTQGPLAALLIAILLSGAMQKWVWGWHYREMRADRDFWRSLGLRSLNVVEAAVTTVARLPTP